MTNQETLARDVETFLANGGRVTAVKPSRRGSRRGRSAQGTAKRAAR
jgi:hypothetical protein